MIGQTTAAQTARPSAPAPVSLFPVRTVWTLALNNQLTAPPVYDGSHAYFAIEGDRLVAYELEHGRQEWIAPALDTRACMAFRMVSISSCSGYGLPSSLLTPARLASSR